MPGGWSVLEEVPQVHVGVRRARRRGGVVYSGQSNRKVHLVHCAVVAELSRRPSGSASQADSPARTPAGLVSKTSAVDRSARTSQVFRGLAAQLQAQAISGLGSGPKCQNPSAFIAAALPFGCRLPTNPPATVRFRLVLASGEGKPRSNKGNPTLQADLGHSRALK